MERAEYSLRTFTKQQPGVGSYPNLEDIKFGIKSLSVLNFLDSSLWGFTIIA